MSTVWQETVSLGENYSNIASHNTFPASAAAFTGQGNNNTVFGRIDVFGKDGEKVEKAGVKKDGTKVEYMDWHPQKKILAAGWSNGSVTIWNDSEQTVKDAIGHRAAITRICWSPKGQRLITTDADGEVIVWRCDVRGRLTSLCQYRMNTAITHCVFRPDPKKSDDPKAVESPPFFLGCANGSVHYADDMGHCSEEIRLGSPILEVLVIEASDTLVIVNEDLVMSQYNFTPECKLQEIMAFKLSASIGFQKKMIQIKWVGPAILAVCSGAKAIRIWDLLEDESTALSANDNQRLMNFAYSNQKNILSASTDDGQIVMWKRRLEIKGDVRSITWELFGTIPTGVNALNITWAAFGSYMFARNESNAAFYAPHHISYKVIGKTTCIQVASNKVLLSRGSNFKIVEIDPQLKIKSLSISSENMSIATGTLIETYNYTQDFQTVESVGSFLTTSSQVHLDGTSVIVGYPHRIDICNFQGTVKNSIKIEESEGELLQLDECNKCIVLTTSKHFLKMYDVSRRDPRILITRKLDDFIPLQSILSVKCSTGGSFLSFMAQMKRDEERLHDHIVMLYLYNVDGDRFTPMDFGPHITPISHHWDVYDGRILICEVEGYVHHKAQLGTAVNEDNQNLDKAAVSTAAVPHAHLNDKYKEVVTTFVTADHGIMEKDRSAVTSETATLIGVSMPFYYYFKKPEDLHSSMLSNSIQKRTMHDFEGMEEADGHTVKAMVDFSFFLMLGNMDDAFKAIQSVRNKTVWEHLAKICVKTNRLDVAAHCLSHMGCAHAIKAMRNASREPEPDVKRAILAAYLGLFSEAEQLLIGCNRYDVLSRLYEANGQWGKSLEISGSKDRINLKTTYHKFGKYLGEIGDISGAIAAYEKSAAFSFEVPRMLLMKNGELEKYINTSEEKGLKKWWAQFAESQGDYATALKYYEAAEDILSIVRVHCYCNNITQAIEIAQKTKNPAAAYHIARHYENEKKITEAINFYTAAKCFRHAIRIAKEEKMENDLMHLALQGNKDCMLDVARYYEASSKNMEKAISLYFKAGYIARAVELCFKTKNFLKLGDFVQDLDRKTDASILKKCASFFLENSQYDKAVPLLVKAGEFNQALEYCIEKNVILTEDMANDMTAGYGSDDDISKGESMTKVTKAVILKIADCCLQQRSFHLASKKYIQAGERIKAIKALLQSGDTEKIIFFATALGSKQKEIFVMVANYLQTLDWRNDPSVMKAIISFYTKAKAIESLAGFYEACSQIEIDEYQNYEKALGALQESANCLSKAKIADKEFKMNAMTRKIDLIQRFVDARKKIKANDSSWIEICESLLNEQDADNAVRCGDIYALMIEKMMSSKAFEKAGDLLKRMRRAMDTANVEYYIDKKLLSVLDSKFGGGSGSPGRKSDDGIKEDIRI